MIPQAFLDQYGMIIAIVLFALTYVLMLVFSKFRPYIALGSAVLFIATGMLPLTRIWGTGIDMSSINVLLMIAGTMGLVSLFIKSKMPALLADLVMECVPNVMWAAVALSLFAGVISAFVDNVATVLMVAPVALEICKKLKTNPVPFIIAVAVSSNLQGAATLVGDTTAIMLGGELNMSFLDFFWYQGRPGMFFIVELGALVSALILMFLFRKEKGKIPKAESRTKVTDYVPTVLLCLVLVLLITASFIPNMPEVTNGAICCSLLLVGLVYTWIRNKSFKAVLMPLKEIDYETILLLVGLFLMIGGIKAQGVIDMIGQFLGNLGGSNLFLMYTIIVWASVLISAFIDNIPYVATMLGLIPTIAATMAGTMGIENPMTVAIPLYFGLLSGATLGGNCTPIGASANITGIGILRKAGYTVKNGDFFKIGIPFTLAAIIPAYIVIWLFFGV